MKNKTKIIISSLILTLSIASQTFAAVAIKPNTTAYTGIKIGDAFDQCLAMKASGGALAGSNVDVHMATNKEWGTVSYFSNSPYGTNGAGRNTGVSVTINGTQYLSTNGNATGVMDWGKKVTYMGSLISGYSSIRTDAEAYKNGKSLIVNASSGLIDFFGHSTDAASIGANTWYTDSTWYIFDANSDYPFSVRSGLFGFKGGKKWEEQLRGKADNSITFRPVLFNQ